MTTILQWGRWSGTEKSNWYSGKTYRENGEKLKRENRRNGWHERVGKHKWAGTDQSRFTHRPYLEDALTHSAKVEEVNQEEEVLSSRIMSDREYREWVKQNEKRMGEEFRQEMMEREGGYLDPLGLGK